MIDADSLAKAVRETVYTVSAEDGLRAVTQCLFPSNSSVAVSVRGGGNAFIISDDGAALSEIASSGANERPSDRQIRSAIGKQGLKVEKGVIFSPPVAEAEVPFAVMLVANAAKTVADWGLEHMRFAAPRNFRKDLADLLHRHFHDNLKEDQPILGKSNKPHKFGHVIYLEQERRLLVDPVVNDSSSINARLVANLDVKMLNDPNIQQLIVFDDRLEWSASDLHLLSLGGPVVGFSRAEIEIERLAA